MINPESPPQQPSLICLAHRGASGHAPENTLAAFQKAIDLGADWIELDVFAVAGRLVVIHDQHLDRTTNGRGEVTQCPLAYLKSLDAGWNQPIPFLEEVLAATGRRIKINIELKGAGTAALTIRLLQEQIERHGWRHADFLLSSFDRRQIEFVHQQAPDFNLALNISEPDFDYVAAMAELPLYSLHLDLAHASAAIIRTIHQHHGRAFVFTANTRRDILRLREMKADGAFTDYPELITGRGQSGQPEKNSFQ